MTARPNILFLVHRVPYPPNRGDRIRSYHILKFLAERADVSLATLADEPVEESTVAELNRLCRRVAIEPVTVSRWIKAAGSMLAGRSATEGLFASHSLRRSVDQWTRQVRFDAVVVFCSSMVQYLDLDGLTGVPAFVDLVDVDSQKFLDYGREASWAKRMLYRMEGRRLRRVEISLPKRAQSIALVSQAEADLYTSFCPNDRTHAVGNGVDLEYFQPCDVEVASPSCVFVGAMDYYPNASGAVWFCEEDWPRVLAEYPDASFNIVGRNPSPAVQRLATLRGVQVIGTVPDVRPYVASAAAVVVPMRIARGIQNKVLEAMAMAKPVVASPEALDGLGIEVGRDALAARSAEEWLLHLRRVFGEPGCRSVLSRSARRYVEQNHAWTATLQPLARLLGLDEPIAACEPILA